MKTCRVCKINKNTDEFPTRKESKQGVRSECKECRSNRQKLRARTKDGLVSSIYHTHNKSAKSQSKRKPEYTKQELQEWLYSKSKFHEMYNEWVNSNYERRLAPRVTRLNINIHHCISNLLLTTESNYSDTIVSQSLLLEMFSYNESEDNLVWDTVGKNSGKNGEIAGTLRCDGYYSIAVKGSLYLVHRLIWMYEYGCFPDGFIDHVDGNKSNNHISNLRDVTPEESNRNMPKPKDNTSGVIGVSWSKHANMWLARINHKKKTINLGYFKDFEDAVSARKEAEVNYKYHKNHGRDMQWHNW